MSYSLSITETDLMTAIGNYLTTILPAGTVILQSQQNRIPMPDTPNWVTINSILGQRIATNVDTWSNAGTPTTQTVATSTRQDVQVDCYGPLGHDNATVISNLFFDDYTVQFFAASGFDIAPLYASDLRNLQFINDQSQYEKRWSLDLSLEVKPVMSVPQQFAGALGPVKLVDIP